MSTPSRPVLFALSSLEIGGSARAVETIANSLDRQKWQPQILSFSYAQAAGVVLREDVQIHPAREGDATGLKKLLSDISPAIIVACDFHAGLALRQALPNSVPLLILAREKQFPAGWRARRGLRELLGRSRAVAVPGGDLPEFLQTEFRVAKEKIRVIPYGVDLARFSTGEGWRVRGELHLDAGAPVVGAVVRMIPENDIEFILQAMAKVAAKMPEVALILAGDGSEYKRLEFRVDELGLSRAVRFAGLRSDIPDVLAACDVFVSYAKEPSLAVSEALVAGLPVALPENSVYRQGQPVELAADPGAMAKIILPWLQDETARKTAGNKASAYAREFCSAGEMAGRFEKMLAEAVNDLCENNFCR
jgi:glycosyltransferase involved in cell wall biosynthesis